jgi:hypothetical protein
LGIILEDSTRDGEHPADAANLALMRVSGILASLSSLFDDRRAQYAVDVPFVAQSIKAVTSLVEEATQALIDLHNSCDLTLLDQGTADHAEEVLRDEVAEPDDAEIDFNTLRRRVEIHISASHVPLPTVQSAATNDAPAASYEELLQKVTAAEVFANAQASQISGGETSMLLPILHSLKQDILRMKRVA